MDTRTGKIYTEEEATRDGIPKRFLRTVTRDLTAKETLQRQIRLYSPCGCGSGKKFKFCCRGKAWPSSRHQPDGTEKEKE